ncbi:hypothetical protein NL676_026323 [Syzygium grande]|nr:hypothetical protein NL676_026323 [Syzygium grande]
MHFSKSGVVGALKIGRGSAYETAIIGLAVMYLLAQAKAATYVVGRSEGWTFNMENWPNGKSFRAGDTLIFKYDP